MTWKQGRLHEWPDSGNPPRLFIEGSSYLHCADGLEVKVGGVWHRGRVEFNDALGWYWTDNEGNVPLRSGMEARVWDGWDWPHERR